ncbi:MAG: PUP1 family protein [Dehalococcoidia bacterium]|nr:PUP1 family protein [Dehalococcoidia bacterium]
MPDSVRLAAILSGWGFIILGLIMAVAYVVVIPHKRLLTAVPISFLLGVIFLVIAMIPYQ